MRKIGIVVTILLLVAVLALMVVSAGLLPFPSGTRNNVAVATPFTTAIDEETKYVVENRAKLRVDTSHGRIFVQGADVDEIQIKMDVETRASTQRRAQEILSQVSLEITTTEGENHLEVLVPKLKMNEMAKADLTILVPVKNQLDLKTNLGQVQVANIQGHLRVFDGLGAIKVDNFEGDAYLETSLGNIEISNSQFRNELVALSHLGNLIIEASLAERNVLESSLGDLKLLLLPEESYVLEGSISLGKFNIKVPFKGQQSNERIQGIIGEGEQRGSIFVSLSLGSLDLKY